MFVPITGFFPDCRCARRLVPQHVPHPNCRDTPKPHHRDLQAPRPEPTALHQMLLRNLAHRIGLGSTCAELRCCRDYLRTRPSWIHSDTQETSNECWAE